MLEVRVNLPKYALIVVATDVKESNLPKISNCRTLRI